MNFFTPLWRAFISNRVYRLFPLLILILAAALRLHLLDNQSFWNDEGNTLRLVQRAPADLIAASNRDIHPPGYYLALKVWYALTGDSEFALRAFSALASVLTVAAVYALGNTLFAPGAGMLAALLTALNTFSIYYGQEARMYAALALLSALSMLIFVRWIRTFDGVHPPTLKRVLPLSLALAVVNAAGLYTQYSFPAVMAVQGIMVMLWMMPRANPAPRSLLNVLIGFVTVNLLTLVLFLPQLASAIAQITGWPRGTGTVDAGEGFATIVRWLVYGNTFGVKGQSVELWVYVWPLLFVLAGLLPDWLRRPHSGWRRAILVVWIALPIIGFFALGLFKESYLKFLLPVQIPVALLIGRGIWLLWEIGSPMTLVVLEALPRLAAVFGLLSMTGFSGNAIDHLYDDPAHARADYRAIARAIAADARPGDAIILDAPNQHEVFTYYYRDKFDGAAPIYAFPKGLGGDDAKAIKDTEQVIAAHGRIFAVFWGEAERDPNRVVEKTLSANTFEVSQVWHGDVRLVTYAVMPDIGAAYALGAEFGDSITLESVALNGTTFRPGDVIGLALNWRTDTRLDVRYRVTVQLLDSVGRLAAQRDAEPGNDMALTTTWEPGKPVRDTHGLPVPPNLSPGAYALIVALYDINNPAARLPVVQGGQTGDSAKIAQVEVIGKP